MEKTDIEKVIEIIGEDYFKSLEELVIKGRPIIKWKVKHK